MTISSTNYNFIIILFIYHIFHISNQILQLNIIVCNRAVIILHSNTQNFDLQAIFKLTHKRYSNWPSSVTQNFSKLVLLKILIHKRYSKVLLKISGSQTVRDVQALIKVCDPQTLLKISYPASSGQQGDTI